MPTATALDSSPFWNLLDSTDDGYADAVYAGKLAKSTVNAINHTVAATDGMHRAMQSIVRWQRFYRDTPSVFQAYSSGDALKAQADGRTAIFMGFQGIDPLEGDLNMIEAYHSMGLRFLQPTYQRRTLAGEGCGEPTAGSVGLSSFGRDLVGICNDLGIVLDISHVGERTSLDIIERSAKPVIATHSAARGLVDCVRNKTDREITALAETGGVIGIAGKSLFLTPEYATKGSTLDDYLRHIDYICSLAGDDVVAIGTDISDERRYTPEMLRKFGEAYPEIPLGGDTFRAEIANTRDIPTPADTKNILAELTARGYGPDTIDKIKGRNAHRACAANF